MRDKQRNLIALLSFILVIITTFAYSALATNLAITGEAVFRTPADIRVTGVSLNNASGATTSFEPSYTKDTITAGFVLNDTTSSISYDVTITNSGLRDQAIYDLITQSSNNSGLNILIDGQPINEVLPIIVPYGTSKTITITYSSSTPGRVDVVNKFDFRKVYYISYNTKGGSSIATQTKYENVDLVLTRDEPTLSGRRFLGWTDEQNGTIVKFSPGDTYTIDGDNKILYAIYSEDQYTITFDYNDGSTPSTTKDVSTGDPVGTLPTPTREGYTLAGWFTESTGGTQITSSTVPTGDTTYYAHWTANELIIENQTLSNGTYGTAYTSNAFTAATNGTGSYTYTIKSGAPTGATINSTNRTISFTNTTNAGTYNVVVTVTDDNSNATKDVTLKIVINKATPVITLSYISGTINAGATTSITATVKSGGGSVSGTLTASSTNSNIVSVAPTSTSITNADNSTGVATNEVITGVAGGSTNINFNFTPTDTNNYNSAVQKQYAATVNNKVIITINKDGSIWSNSNKNISLFKSNQPVYQLTTSGSTASVTSVAADTYDVYSLETIPDCSTCGTTNNYVDTGVDITVTATDGVTSNATGTIDYYTLTVNKGTNVLSIFGNGVYLSTQTAYIDADLFTTGYHFNEWTKSAGNTPTSTSTASTTVSMNQTTTLTATATINTYSIEFDNNSGTGTMTSITDNNYNTSVTLTNNSFTKFDHTFIGWNTKSDGTGTPYLDGAPLTINSSLISEYGLENSNGAITLYAQWISNGEVTITGVNKVGSTLSANITTAPVATPTGYSYQWYRGDTVINGATTATYTPVEADIGYKLKVIVTANYTNYASITFEDTTDENNNTYELTHGNMVCTNAVAKIEGIATGPGSELTATVTTVPVPTPDSYTYQWYRDDEVISGAIQQTYTTIEDDIDATIKVVIKGVKTNYASCSFEDSIDEENNKSDTIISVRAVDLYYDNSETGIPCETAQCALDYIARILKRSNVPDMTGNDYLCKRSATTQLHSNPNGGTFGQVGTEGILTTGDAFICDVNGDGNYNSGNEMFYYVSDYYDTSTQTTNSNYATLVYYNNVSEGLPSNTAASTYDSANNNQYGPRTAIIQLPDTLNWQDSGLYKNSRAILNESAGTSTSGGTLPTAFSYKGYSSRLLTYQEVYNGCYDGSTSITSTDGLLNKCKFLMENTKYSDSSLMYGEWLETPNDSSSTTVWIVKGVDRRLETFSANYGNTGVRPVIDVKKSDIDLSEVYEPITITFNANGGTGTMSNQVVQINSTNTLSANAFTRTNYKFTGWNTKADGSGTSYTNRQSVTLSENLTLYAQWQLNTYTVTFKANGGTGTMPNQTITANTATALTANAFTRVDYIFNGWNTKADGSGTSYSNKKSVTLTSNLTLYAQWLGPYICKRVTSSSSLHTATCAQSSTGCGTVEGNGNTITFGNAKSKGAALASGDAFDCDLNKDGTYNQRFYYVSNYYNTSSKSFDSSYATLIYYTNVSGGSASNSTTYAYDSSNENWHGPRTALAQLPTTSQWTNVSLYKTSRAILAEYESSHNKTTTSGGTLPTAFSYSGKAARLLTAKELMNACSLSTVPGAIPTSCKYLLENTIYVKSSLKEGHWLETPIYMDSTPAYMIYGSRKEISPSVTNQNTSFGVRPTIDVIKTKLYY